MPPTVKSAGASCSRTDWVNGADTLAANAASPPYAAVMAWSPTASSLVGALLAVPPTRPTACPSGTPSAANCTVPVGTPPPGTGVTVAVKVTACPGFAGLSDDATTVEVGAGSAAWRFSQTTIVFSSPPATTSRSPSPSRSTSASPCT